MVYSLGMNNVKWVTSMMGLRKVTPEFHRFPIRIGIQKVKKIQQTFTSQKN